MRARVRVYAAPLFQHERVYIMRGRTAMHTLFIRPHKATDKLEGKKLPSAVINL